MLDFMWKVKNSFRNARKDVEDLRNLVKFVNYNKEKYPELSLTGRSGGTDMTGGPLTESVVVSFTKYMNRVNYGSRSGVITDQCGKHGTWLESGELRSLLERWCGSAPLTTVIMLGI